MDKVRVGILGAGGIANRHFNALAGNPKAEVTAICDIEIEKAREMAGRTKNAKAFGSLDSLLAETRVDAMYVCMPPFAHSGEVEMLAARGTHLFLEKPIALTAERARSMTAACTAAGIVTQVGYHHRCGAAIRRLKTLIDSGVAGPPTLFDGRYACNSLHGPWWREREKSGGQLLEQVIHTYDLCMYLFGEPESVCGFTANIGHRDVENYTSEDTGAGIVRFKSGALAAIASTNNAEPGKWINSYSVFCKNLTVHFENSNQAEFIFTGENPPRTELVNEDTDLAAIQCDSFLDVVLGKTQPICPVTEGLHSLLLVESVVESARQGGLPVQYRR